MVDFFDITFNLNNGTYNPYKKPNNPLLYINKSCNHQPQMIYQLRRIYTDRLSRNSSNNEVFNASKREYEEALKCCGYSIISFSFKQSSKSQQYKIQLPSALPNPILSPPPRKKIISPEMELSSSNIKKFLICCQKSFSFPEMEPCTLHPRPEK